MTALQTPERDPLLLVHMQRHTAPRGEGPRRTGQHAGATPHRHWGDPAIPVTMPGMALKPILISNAVRAAVFGAWLSLGGCAALSPAPATDATGWQRQLQATAPLPEVLLLGEQHDAPEHQAWERDTVQTLARRSLPVILISGFSLPHSEFYTPYRVINFHVCNGCWTDSSEEFVHADFAWCPRHENTEREFECTRFISAGQVCQHIDRLMADYDLDPKVGKTRERMAPQPSTEAAEDALHTVTAPAVPANAGRGKAPAAAGKAAIRIDRGPAAAKQPGKKAKAQSRRAKGGKGHE